MTNPRQELGELWRSVNREMHDAFRHAFRDHEFSPVTLVLLKNIHEEPGVTMSELARRSGIVKSHVSRMVDQLVQQGIIEKRPDPDDQRLVRLYLTQAAANTKAELEGRARTVLNGIVGEIPDGELDQIVGGFRILLQALQTFNEKVNP